MKKLLMVGLALAALMGCSSTPKAPPPNFENISVVVANGKTLKDAIVHAAARRRWLVSEVSANVLRCSILQRSNKVEIDISVQGPTTHSIRFVSSNIPANKYLKWVNNLQHDIAKNAR